MSEKEKKIRQRADGFSVVYSNLDLQDSEKERQNQSEALLDIFYGITLNQYSTISRLKTKLLFNSSLVKTFFGSEAGAKGILNRLQDDIITSLAYKKDESETGMLGYVEVSVNNGKVAYYIIRREKLSEKRGLNNKLNNSRFMVDGDSSRRITEAIESGESVEVFTMEIVEKPKKSSAFSRLVSAGIGLAGGVRRHSTPDIEEE